MPWYNPIKGPEHHMATCHNVMVSKKMYEL